MAEGARADLRELLLHFAGEAADRSVVEPFGNGVLLGLLQALDGALLLQEVAFVLDFGFDGLEFVADLRKKDGPRICGLARISSFEELWGRFSQDRKQVLDCDFGALQELGQAFGRWRKASRWP